VELESNPARLGKGTSRLWDLILLGRDGMETETETRRLVLLANHAALDGDSICLWLAQVLAALPRHAKVQQNEEVTRDGPEQYFVPRSQACVPCVQGCSVSASSSSVVPLGPAMDVLLRKSMDLRRLVLNPHWMMFRAGL
jgi:hypothetical protein